MDIQRDPRDSTPICPGCGIGRLEKPQVEAISSIGGELDDFLEAEAVRAVDVVVECPWCGKMWKVSESLWPRIVTVIG
jgi:hypothetical protein